MKIRRLSLEGYRSIRKLQLDLSAVNLLTGPNGCGKSNLYNAMFLLSKAATGGLARAIAEEGGMPSALTALREKVRLTRKAPPRRIRMSVELDEFRYELQLGLPQCGPPTATPSLFLLDPEVKEESITIQAGARPVSLMERKGPTAYVRDADGALVQYPLELLKTESVLAQISEPHRYPELSMVREQMRAWRFYHQFRTDSGSPLRSAQTGVFTPVLDHDGSNLAAAIQTIEEIGMAEDMRAAIERAFPGARLSVDADGVRFRIQLQMPGVMRPLEATELSDGTLRYLCLMAALLSPRLPPMLALNEPETSLHPDLIEPLARLIAGAARNSQLWITTHSQVLAKCVEELSGVPRIALRMTEGETTLVS